MSSVEALLQALEDRDIRLEVVDDRLRVDAPRGALTPELRRRLQQDKALLLSALRRDWASDAHKVIEALPNEALRAVLHDCYDTSVASLVNEQQHSRVQAQQQAFGLLLYQLLRCGIDVATAPRASQPTTRSSHVAP